MEAIPLAAATSGSAMQQDHDRSPNPVDVHVGTRIHLRRTLMGMSQERLGEALGLTFQQVQKYERGVNRVGASRLFDLSRVFDVPISFFYDDLPDLLASRSGTYQTPSAVESLSLEQSEIMNRRETLELVRAYYRINEPSVRKRVFELIKSMGPIEF